MTTATLNARTIVGSALYQDMLRQRDEAMDAATRYREALVHQRGQHEPDGQMFCEHDGISWPCPDREFLDELLHPTTRTTTTTDQGNSDD